MPRNPGNQIQLAIIWTQLSIARLNIPLPLTEKFKYCQSLEQAVVVGGGIRNIFRGLSRLPALTHKRIDDWFKI